MADDGCLRTPPFDAPATTVDRPFKVGCSILRILRLGLGSGRLAGPRASSLATPDAGVGCGRRQRGPRWSAERRPGFLARGRRATGPPPPSSDLGPGSSACEAGRSQGWPKGADRKAPWAPPGAPSLFLWER